MSGVPGATLPRGQDERDEHQERYEIVVRGRVGRAVQVALRPLRATVVHDLVVRTRPQPGSAVAELLAALAERGVRVRSLVALGAHPVRPHARSAPGPDRRTGR